MPSLGNLIFLKWIPRKQKTNEDRRTRHNRVAACLSRHVQISVSRSTRQQWIGVSIYSGIADTFPTLDTWHCHKSEGLVKQKKIISFRKVNPFSVSIHRSFSHSLNHRIIRNIKILKRFMQVSTCERESMKVILIAWRRQPDRQTNTPYIVFCWDIHSDNIAEKC